MITHQELIEQLDYNPTTGVFTWLITKDPRPTAGDTAGTKHKSGYTAIGINGKIYYAHKLAAYWMTGKYPKRVALRDKNSTKWNDIVVL